MRDLPPNMTDYLATRASFRLEVPERYNYARDVLDAWAEREPGKLALLAVGPDGGAPAASASPTSPAPPTVRPGSWPARGSSRATGCS
jgi:hypothetical protein